MTAPTLRSRVLLLALLALAAALLGPAAAGAKTRVYKSPGYKGTRKLPKTKAPPLPTPVALGSGQHPHVIVDAAGTAHAVWNEPAAPNPDVLRYCRLKRGGKGCDASSSLVPAQDYGLIGNSPGFNNEFGQPRVLSIGDQLVLLTHRYPNSVVGPDGVERSNNTYMYVSNDGGTTFGDPALAGDGPTSGIPAVFGPGDAPRIGLISDTETGGPFFQALSPGQFTSTRTVLGVDGVDSSVAPLGDSVAVAFGSIDGQVHVRVWSGQGDPGDASTWGAPMSFAGDEGHLAAGPSGTFLLNRGPLSSHQQLVVRRVTSGSLGAPVTIPGTANGVGIPDLAQDASGRLLVTYRISVGSDEELVLRSSTDGVHWSSAQVILRVPGTTGIWSSGIAAIGDGGGFAVAWETTVGNSGPIVAVPFGSQGPTGQHGLGDLAGGSADPSVVETCQRISFGPVHVLGQGSCLLSAVGKPGVKVSSGTLRLNGLEIVPEGNAQILLDAHRRTIDTTGTVRVQLRAPGIDPIVLFRGELHIRLADEQAAAASATASAAAAGVCGGQQLASFNGGGALVKGFPINGSIDVRLEGDGVCVPVALGLPKAFGGITGAATLRADNTHGLQLDSLRVAVAQALIGPVILKDLLVSYDGPSDEWDGRATLGLPPQPGGAELGAGVRFKGGAFKEGSLALTFPFPGIALDPFAASYLRQVSGDFALDPLTLAAGVQFGVLPLAPPAYTFEVDGRLTVAFRDPVTFTFDGSGKMLTFPIASERLIATTDGFVRGTGNVGIDLDAVSVNGSLDAFVDARSRSFGGDIRGTVCVAGVCPAGGEAVLSSKGIGGCVHQIVDYGFGYMWGASITDVDVMFGSCDLGPYKVAPPPGSPARAGAHAAADTERTVTVAGGSRLLSLALVGEGGPPTVTLVSPSGAQVVPSDPTAGGGGAAAFAHRSAPLATTWVAVPHPAAGQWRVEVAAGSPPIAQLSQATPLPAPRASARVGRAPHGARVLRYRASIGGGLATTFVERWSGGEHRLGRAAAAAGTLRFAPAPGPGGRRTIVALVERDGMPRMRTTVASYVAPAPPRPARVRGLTLRHRGGSLVVGWGAVRGARTYLVRLDLADGRHLLRVLGARTRSLRADHVGKRERATLRVAARDASGRSGPLATRRG